MESDAEWVGSFTYKASYEGMDIPRFEPVLSVSERWVISVEAEAGGASFFMEFRGKGPVSDQEAIEQLKGESWRLLNQFVAEWVVSSHFKQIPVSVMPLEFCGGTCVREVGGVETSQVVSVPTIGGGAVFSPSVKQSMSPEQLVASFEHVRLSSGPDQLELAERLRVALSLSFAHSRFDELYRLALFLNNEDQKLAAKMLWRVGKDIGVEVPRVESKVRGKTRIETPYCELRNCGAHNREGQVESELRDPEVVIQRKAALVPRLAALVAFAIHERAG